MSRTPRLTDAVLRAALMPAPEVAAPPSLLASIAADVRRTPQQRSRLGLPWSAEPPPVLTGPLGRQFVLVIAAAGLLMALVGGALVGSRLLAPPQSTVPTPSPPPAPPSRPLAVAMTLDVTYDAGTELIRPGRMDVHAPSDPGSWPVVVMLHGTPFAVDQSMLTGEARRVAERGFVVYNAAWGQPRGAVSDLDPYEYATANNAQVACAIAFARAHAADYGGDPSRVIVFGHSGGSNSGSVVVFGDVEPAVGCLADGPVAPVAAFVTQDGDYLLAPDEDALITDDPRVMDAMTPWSVLGRHPELPVVMLSAGELGPDVSGPLPAPEQPAYLALRDRDGTIGRLVATTGVLDDEQISVDDMMTVFHEALVEQGNPVTWDVLPGSTITALSSAGWEVFLAAFDKAAAGETGG